MNDQNSECCSNHNNPNLQVNQVRKTKDFDKETIYAILSVILVIVGTILKHSVKDFFKK